MYAIVKNGGKQYRVQEGDILFLDRLSLEDGTEVNLDVLAISNEGELSLNGGGQVTAEVMEEARARKVLIYKKRRRKDSKLKRGFRRSYTKVKITAISA